MRFSIVLVALVNKALEMVAAFFLALYSTSIFLVGVFCREKYNTVAYIG